MFKKFFLALAITAVGFVFYMYSYLGFNRPVEIELGERQMLQLLAKNHMGAYHQIGPVISDVEQWANAHNIHCPQTFGEYLDDPAAMDQDRLRSRGGCVLTSPLPADLELPKGFAKGERPARKYVIARFQGSPSIGPMKVYPLAQKFIEDQRLKVSGAVIEIYTVNGKDVTTEFLFPIEK